MYKIKIKIFKNKKIEYLRERELMQVSNDVVCHEKSPEFGDGLKTCISLKH